jgi:hypothetical protein
MKHNKKVYFEEKDKEIHLKNLAKYDMEEAKRNANYRNVIFILLFQNDIFKFFTNVAEAQNHMYKNHQQYTMPRKQKKQIMKQQKMVYHNAVADDAGTDKALKNRFDMKNYVREIIISFLITLGRIFRKRHPKNANDRKNKKPSNGTLAEKENRKSHQKRRNPPPTPFI